MEIGGKKIKVKTEVVEGEILLIIGKEEYGMTTDMKKKKKEKNWRKGNKSEMER